jgi:EF hand
MPMILAVVVFAIQNAGVVFLCFRQLASIADRTMVEADTDNDNMISFHEFKEIMAKVDIEQRMSIRFLS